MAGGKSEVRYRSVRDGETGKVPEVKTWCSQRALEPFMSPHTDAFSGAPSRSTGSASSHPLLELIFTWRGKFCQETGWTLPLGQTLGCLNVSAWQKNRESHRTAKLEPARKASTPGRHPR